VSEDSADPTAPLPLGKIREWRRSHSAGRVELAHVLAGARNDLGQPEAGLILLDEVQELADADS
jgi:hypothetical protein